MSAIRTAQRAFTLVELLLAVGIAVIIVGALFLAMRTGQQTYTSMDTSVQVQEQVWRAFDQMRELERAGGTPATLNILCGQCGLDFQLGIDYAGGAVTLGAIDRNGVKQPGWHVVYRLEDAGGQRQLVRMLQNGGGGDVPGEIRRVLANYVATPTPTPVFELSGTTVKVHLQITTPTNSALPGGNRTSGLLTTQFQFRNSP